MAFAEELSALRKRLSTSGLSVGEVLTAAGVDRSTWTRWNSGTFRPRFESWSAVCAATDRLIAERAKPKRKKAA